jgi:hypothetical protein
VQSGTISFVLKDSAGNTITATVSYNSATTTATLTPSAALVDGVTYKVMVSGDENVAGYAMTNPVSWSFTIG